MMDMQPEYPSVPGQPIPDLGLAMYGMADSRTTLYPNSDSTGPVNCAPPPLQRSDISNLGIDPGVPYFDLQLANQQPVSSPAQLSQPQGLGGINAPTFTAPDMSVPALRMGDLQAAEIDVQAALTPDSQTSDLLHGVHPSGLSVIATCTDPDPLLPDLDDYDRPAGLGMPGPLTPDPLLPDLQKPDLEQRMTMPDRPGDLASDALSELHNDPTYKELPTRNPRDLWLQQQGNSRRARHLGLLSSGLDDADGQGKEFAE